MPAINGAYFDKMYEYVFDRKIYAAKVCKVLITIEGMFPIQNALLYHEYIWVK